MLYTAMIRNNGNIQAERTYFFTAVSHLLLLCDNLTELQRQTVWTIETTTCTKKRVICCLFF